MKDAPNNELAGTVWRTLRQRFAVRSGPRVIRLFHRAFALVAIAVWLSLNHQVLLLFGEHGLLPIEDIMQRATARDVSFLELPTWMWLGWSDGILVAGTWIGVLFGVLALFGVFTRTALFGSAFLYLGYVTVGAEFLAFQWDNLFIELSVLAALLPRNRESPWLHALLRLALFKLYFESGMAKWQSPIHDWHDGSAMTFYYETSPLPTWLAWYAHNLPHWWHVLESWAALALELFGAFLLLGPRRARIAALIVFSGFQVINLATSNYGFFVYITLAAHVMLLDESDVERLTSWLANRLPDRLLAVFRWLEMLDSRLWWPSLQSKLPGWRRASHSRIRTGVAVTVVSLWLALSLMEGLAHFAGYHGADFIRQPARRFRVANKYFLFTAITRSRTEPTVETSIDGGQTWTEHQFLYKSDDPEHAPSFVAPHQPRVDFRLWFYGLRFTAGRPRYVANLLDRLCHQPHIVQPLFSTQLPDAPSMVRFSFYSHTFTSPSERDETGRWWNRTRIAHDRPLVCRPRQ